MIAKHIPMRARKRSNYGELVRYLLDPQTKHERVGQVSVTNCQSMEPMVAAIEVLNTQSLNLRASGDKTYHLVLSFRAGEQPDAATLQALEEQVCSALGYADHQRVSVVHHDTYHLHVHLAINKIHPVRHTMQTPFNDHLVLGKVCQRLEREYGLQQDNHIAQKRRGESQTADMERHAGIESLAGWIKRECWDDLQRAENWAELHGILTAHGLTLKERGNGLVIQSGDGTTIKASSLARGFSKAGLEQRYGAFAAAAEPAHASTAGKCYERKPVGFGIDTAALYARYKAERARAVHDGQRAYAEVRTRKELLIADAKRSASLKRAAIKLLAAGWLTKKLLLAAVSRTLISTIKLAQQQYRGERRHLQLIHRRLAWADWLRVQAQRGDAEALAALRSRKGSVHHGQNTLSGRHGGPQNVAGADSVTKHGTVIICAGTTVLRDDGARLTVTRDGDQAGLRTALRVAAERYGQCLHVDGSAAFREQIVRAAATSRLHITFDDAALERRRLELIRATFNRETNDENAEYTKQRRLADRSIPSTGAASYADRACSIKPDIGGVGGRPPPPSRNRLRKLSQLGLVRIPGGSAMLLPRDVSGHVEQQGPAADHSMRRHLHRAGGVAATAVTPGTRDGAGKPKAGRHRMSSPPPMRGAQMPLALEGAAAPQPPRAPVQDLNPPASSSQSVPKHEIPSIAAATQYVLEREQRRLTIADIPKHLVYDGFLGEARFAGLRTIDGQHLALLERGGTFYVSVIDEATQRRLQRVARGTSVMVGQNGAIRRKGRSR